VSQIDALSRVIAFVLVFSSLFLLAACGSGSGPNLEGRSESLQNTGEAIAAGLPGLADLPEPDRAAKVAGPGWYQVPVLEQGVMKARGGSGSVSHGPNGKFFTTAGDATWAIFGVYGFDGDMQPNAVMAETLDLSGNYYVGVSHYASGRWEFGGPYSSDETYEYAHAGPFSDASQYVSDKSYHYIAIVLEDGGEMTLSGIQLGVDGGDNAPLIAPYLEISNGDSALALYWSPCPSHNSPDFAGYSVERADWPSNNYMEISPLSKNVFFVDTDILPLIKYRYRLRVEDFNGNFAYGPSYIGLQLPGDNRPIPVLQIPAGPLHGAQTVTFDMSGSFDPDGDPIDEYRLSFDTGNLSSGILPLVTIDDIADIDLQPGCYSIRLTVTANAVSSHSFWQLKVYPEWNPQSSLVASPNKDSWRMEHTRSIFHPGRDSIITFYVDKLGPGLGAMELQADGGRELFHLPFIIGEPRWISEPVIWNDRVYIAVKDSNFNMLYYFDESGLHWEPGFFGSGSYEQLDLVVGFDNTLRICFLNEFNPGEWRIVALDANSPLSAVEVMPLSNSEGWFDVEWNEEAGTYDTIYTSVGSIRWHRTDEEGAIAGQQLIAAGVFSFLEMDVEPQSGNLSLLALSGGLYTYYEYDNDLASWSPLEAIDALGVNGDTADMIIADSNPTVFFGKAGSQSNLYRRNGGSWDATEADWTLLSGYHCALAAWPDGAVNIADGAIGGPMFLLDMQPDGSHGAPYVLDATSYMGQDLNAVAGNAGLQAYWRGDAGSYHYLADAGGSNWLPGLDLGQADAIDLMADAQGDVYISHTVGNFAELRRWTGAVWILESGWFRWGEHHPFLAAQKNALGAQWKGHDNSVLPAQIRYMHDDDDTVILPDFFTLDDPQIMEGVSLWTADGLISCVTATDAGVEAGRVGFLNQDTSAFSQLFDAETANGDVSWTRGRQLDGANYIHGENQLRSVFWSGFQAGGGVGCSRITGQVYHDNFNVEDTAALESYQFEGNASMLSTVSAAQAWGLTAVGICDQFAGASATLEWSNFGEFEELGLPPLDFARTSMHELVVGVDGRWHILYRDADDGGIYAISTT
jgi:hypothetical protein